MASTASQFCCHSKVPPNERLERTNWMWMFKKESEVMWEFTRWLTVSVLSKLMKTLHDIGKCTGVTECEEKEYLVDSLWNIPFSLKVSKKF